MNSVTQRLTWIVAVVLVVGLLVLGGIVSIKVDVHPPRWAAAEFWTNAPKDGPLQPAYQLWVDLAKAARLAVVNVSTQAHVSDPRAEFFRRFFEGGPPGSSPRSSLGAGFSISPDGYVVTNNHVVASGGDIVVRLSRGTEHPARVVGTDPPTDLALLKIDASSLAVLPLGDSDRLQVGEPVMAIGNPFGLDQTVTTGIVSAKERFIGSGPYDEFVQTDASINPGNSGGPLLDSGAHLIGMNTMIFSKTGSSAGIGFAVPVATVRRVVPQIIDKGRVEHPGLGIEPLPDAYAARVGVKGVVITRTVAGGPAAKAGIRGLSQDRTGEILLGDIIVGINEHKVKNYDDLYNALDRFKVGDEVEVKLVRAGAPATVKLNLIDLP